MNEFLELEQIDVTFPPSLRRLLLQNTEENTEAQINRMT